MSSFPAPGRDGNRRLAAVAGDAHQVSRRSPPMSVPTIAVTDRRNVQLDQLAKLLTDQSTRRLDVIAGPGAIRAEHGQLVLDGTEPTLGPDGVTMTAGRYRIN